MKKNKDNNKDGLERCGCFILFIIAMYSGKGIAYYLFDNSVLRILLWALFSFIILIISSIIVLIVEEIIEKLKNKRS